MRDTRIIDLLEDLFSQNFDTDLEIPTDQIEELLAALECELRERDEE